MTDEIDEYIAKKQTEKKLPRKVAKAERKPKINFGRTQKRRGYQFEHYLAGRLSRFGFERVPLSGSLGGSLSGDLKRSNGAVCFRLAEVKRREGAMKQLRSWLSQGGGVDFVIEGAMGGSDPIVHMTLTKLEELLMEWEGEV